MDHNSPPDTAAYQGAVRRASVGTEKLSRIERRAVLGVRLTAAFEAFTKNPHADAFSELYDAACGYQNVIKNERADT